MLKTVHLHKSLIDPEISRFKIEIQKSKGAKFRRQDSCSNEKRWRGSCRRLPVLGLIRYEALHCHFCHSHPRHNTLPAPSSHPFDPNKHIFPAYGNADALFVQMGAYHSRPFAFAGVSLAQINAVNGDVPTCVSVMSGDIPAH
ncbi:hypothetical protein AAC387_Pa11g0422 [Persea americana]